MRPEDFRELLVTLYVPVSKLPLPTGIQPVLVNRVHVVKIEILAPPQQPSAN
jgi:hypothetical protein